MACHQFNGYSPDFYRYVRNKLQTDFVDKVPDTVSTTVVRYCNTVLHILRYTAMPDTLSNQQHAYRICSIIIDNRRRRLLQYLKE
jgi:hypothetical protein